MALLQAVIIFMVAIVAIAWATFNSQCSPSFTTTKLRAREPHTFYSGPIIDHVLRGRAYRNATRHSHVTCATFCLQDVGCRSFNYCPGIKHCELNSDVFATDKSDLQPSSGCLYFDEEYHKAECVAVTRSADRDLNFKYYPMKSSDTFRIDFAIKGKQFAFMSLSESVNEDNFHLIIIGAWGNNATTISCGNCEGHSPIYNSVPSYGILSEFEFRRFWLSYNVGDIQVGKWGEISPIMEWRDEHLNVIVNYVGISSFFPPASWIMYDFCNA